MKNILHIFLSALLLSSIGIQAESLSIGDPSPKIQTAKWFKGEPIGTLSADHTYVLLFWSVQCTTPCTRNYPVLTDQARQYTNVVFIGINAWDKKQKIEAYLESMSDQMGFRVAMDTADEYMLQNWMKAAGQEGVPAAFIVHQGQMAWIGHPDGLDTAVPKVLSEDFDIETAKKEEALFAQIRAFHQKAGAGATDAELEAEGQELEALFGEYGRYFRSESKWTFNAKEAIQRSRYRTALKNYRVALDAEADEETLATFEAAARSLAQDSQYVDSDIKREREGSLRMKKISELETLFESYFSAIEKSRDSSQAGEVARQIEELENPDPYEINCFAWKILTGVDDEQRDLPLALRMAQTALIATEEKYAPILDTYAHALFDSGDVAKAMEYQQKAIDACKDWEKHKYAQKLKEYQAAEKENTP